MEKVKEQERAFKKISPTEYVIIIEGQPRTIKTSFGLNELLFKEYILGGGIIDIETGEVTTDVLTLISSFRPIGNILLTEYDEDGKVVSKGATFKLGTADLVNLFLLASELIMDFTKDLETAKRIQTSLDPKE